MSPTTTTLTNHKPPATTQSGLKPNPIRREESDTPHERERVAWSLAETGDHRLFDINSAGTLTFRDPPAYQHPTSPNIDLDANQYRITIVATETGNTPNNTAQLPLTIAINKTTRPPGGI